MLATKLQITLVNCKNETVFTANGESRLKKRDKSHVDAIKDALQYTVLNKKKNNNKKSRHLFGEIFFWGVPLTFGFKINL